MRHWLMKSEPDEFSIEDLARSEGPAMWDGCRNYTVRNFLRDAMSDGDLAFFHHSNASPSGIVGVMRIVGDAYPDPTQFDPDLDGYDPKSPRENPRWLARNVAIERRFPRLIPMDELRRTPGLEGMEVLKRGQRLSILPVTPEEWGIVLGLVERAP